MSSAKDNSKKYIKLFWEFMRIGLVTFGGGLAMIPLIQDAVCKKNQWMTDEEMTDCIAVTQSMPGIIAVNVATYVGGKTAGILGGIFAVTGVTIPAFLILVLMLLFNTISQNPFAMGAMMAVKATSCGLILISTWSMGKKIVKDIFSWSVAIIAFVLIAGFNVTAIIPIVLSAVAGIVYNSIKKNRKKDDDDSEEISEVAS